MRVYLGNYKSSLIKSKLAQMDRQSVADAISKLSLLQVRIETYVITLCLIEIDLVMKKILINGMLAATFCFCMASCDTSNQQTDSTEIAEERNEERLPSDNAQDDAEFMVRAASGGMLEVELGRMAQQKAGSPRVKEFANMMVNDHSRANEELKALAARKNIVLPSTPGDEAQEHISELTKYSGAEFDKEYMNLMTKDHQEDISLFEKAAEDSKDREVKAFAAKTLPVLRNHHQMAEQLEDVTSDVNTRADNRNPAATGTVGARR